MATEKNITKAIMNHLKSIKAFAVKLHGGPFQAAGLPDIMCILHGQTVFFEVKTEVGKVTRIQSHCHDRIRKAGGLVSVVRSVDEVIYLLDNKEPSVWGNYNQ